MKIYTVPHNNWHMALADIIETAKDGDTIICHSDAMAELAERARTRMCPEKQLTFTTEEED